MHVLQENLGALKLKLTEDDIKALNALDKNMRYVRDYKSSHSFQIARGGFAVQFPAHG